MRWGLRERATVICLLVAAAPSVRADDLDVGWDSDRNAYYVVEGKQSARLPIYDSGQVIIEREGDGFSVYASNSARTFHFTRAELKAYLEMAARKKLDAAGKHDEAAAAYARAVTLAPRMTEPYLDEAAAWVAAGKKPEAEQALAPLAAANPLLVAWRVLDDARLAPLADWLPALGGKGTGTAALVADTGLLTRFAVAGSTSLPVAAASISWTGLDGSCGLELVLVDRKSGAELLSINVAVFSQDDVSRYPDLRAPALAKVAPTIAKVNRLLTLLDFQPGEAAADGLDDDSYKRHFCFPSAKLGIVTYRGVARLLRGDTDLGQAKVDQYMGHAGVVPGAAVVTTMSRACDMCPDNWRVAVIPLPDAAPIGSPESRPADKQ